MKSITSLCAILLVTLLLLPYLHAQSKLDSLLPVRGLCIAAPRADSVDAFVDFIEEELAPRHVNTLVLRVDYNYQYESRPELADSNGLARADVKKLVEASRRHGIRIIPQINLLGHQSWASSLNNLLEVYPQFDETPHVEMPEEYEWPNEDGLYCKSYCPLHPEVHDVVFDLVDEILDVFEADAFHAGMDEVFYIADDKCPRCGGRDPAELFAGEVSRLRNHLADRDAELWIWGDRLIDGKTTGIGMWEASMNNTYRAVDLIPKDVVICDWHYERAVPTAAYFAMKGFRVVTCPWRRPEVAVEQLDATLQFRDNSPSAMQDRYAGMMQTIWSGADDFLNQFYGRSEHADERGRSQADCFRMLYLSIRELNTDQ
jgi:hypothetical protein